MFLALAFCGSALALDVPVISENQGEFTTDHVSFESRIEAGASCKDAFAGMMQLKNLQELVPHLHAKAEVSKLSKAGDTIWYEFDRKDGTKSTGRFVVTTLEEGNRIQVLVQPDEGSWLRVQEWKLYAPASGAKKVCTIIYEETYNPRALKERAYNVKEIVEEVRKPYMEIILRRLKNMAEGKKPGPADETEKLREIAKILP
jgi:hypothetical protein